MNCIVIHIGPDEYCDMYLDSPTPTFYPTCDPLSNDQQTWLPHVPYEIWMHVKLHKKANTFEDSQGDFCKSFN